MPEIFYRRADGFSSSSRDEILTGVCNVATKAFQDLAEKYPQLGLDPERVAANFNPERNGVGAATMARLVDGNAHNRTGNKKAALFVAQQGGHIVGYVAIGREYPDGVRELVRSYDWIISGALLPELQHGRTAVRGLQYALTCPKSDMPHRLQRIVSAYPYVLPRTSEDTPFLPGEKFLNGLGITSDGGELLTAEPGFLPVELHMARHAASRKKVLQNLREAD